MSQIWGESMRTTFCHVCHVALGTGLYADNAMPLLSSRGLLEPHPHKWGRQDGPVKLHSAHFKRNNENTQSYYYYLTITLTRLIGLYLDRVRGVTGYRHVE